jgi:hypothetical protein
MKKYLWFFSSFFFGLITLSLVIEVAQYVYSHGTDSGLLIGVLMTALAGTFTLYSFGKAQKEA